VPLFIAEMNHLAALESSSKLYRFVKPVQAELRTFATGVAFLAVLNALLYVEAPHFAAASNGPRSKAPGIGALAAGGATSTAEALGAWLAVLLMVVHLVLLSYRLLSDAPLISKARALSEREDAAETALPQRTVRAFVAALARPTAIDAAAVGAAVAVVALNRALEQYMVAVAIVCLAVRLLSKARRLVGAPRGAAGLAYAVVYDVAGHVPIVSHLAVAALAALALCHRPTWCGAALCVDLATAGIGESRPGACSCCCLCRRAPHTPLPPLLSPALSSPDRERPRGLQGLGHAARVDHPPPRVAQCGLRVRRLRRLRTGAL